MCCVNPISFITSIIVQTGSQAKFTIASIGGRYAVLSGQSMEAKSFHNKIKKSAVTELMGMHLKYYADFLNAKFVKPKQVPSDCNKLQVLPVKSISSSAP